jgi:hypothetical protein
MRHLCCRASASLARSGIRQAKRLPYNLPVVSGHQFFHESRIGVAGSAAELMVQMANNEIVVAKIDKLMEQGDRIAPARDADEVPTPNGKAIAKIFAWLNPIH